MSDDRLTYPPGFAGVLAQSIYNASYMPIREVSITAALALLAGLAGRGFRTHTEKDLALYIILVARSGIGKDAIHDGIPTALRYAGVPFAERILRQEDFVSGPALHKALLTDPGFFNLQGEVGRKLKQMADVSNRPMQELRTVMTKAYGATYLEGKAYSRAEDCVSGVPFPALTFLGETTPGTFLESLSSDMMEDGFLSRFLTITYDGDRPKSNPERYFVLPDEFNDHWRGLVENATRFVGEMTGAPTVVGFRNLDAYEKLERFEDYCSDRINESSDEAVRQMYNRAHLKALKIACVLAVADDFKEPKIHLGHATWAITTVRSDIETFQRHQDGGDVGSDDHARFNKVVSIVREYVRGGAPESYKVAPSLPSAAIIPYGYLQKRTSSLPLFRKSRVGSADALRNVIKSLIDSGVLHEMSKQTMVTEHKHHGKAYLVVNLP